MRTLLFAHVAISLVAIGSGFVVAYGLLTARRLDSWTAAFLATTVATSVTGFPLPADHLLPSHVVGIISIVTLAIAIYARYARHLAAIWRPTYVVSALLSLYLNVFVFVVQAFMKVPALKALAPTQSEPPFALTELAVLLLFAVVTVTAVIRFRLSESAAGIPVAVP